MPDPNVDTSVLKTSREACHKARDRFFDCIRDCGLEYTKETVLPKKCIQARKAYEKSCRSSWVAHFDTLHDRETQYHHRVKAIAARAAAKEAEANKAGTESGKAS